MCLQLSICLNVLLHWDLRGCSHIPSTVRSPYETDQNFRIKRPQQRDEYGKLIRVCSEGYLKDCVR